MSKLHTRQVAHHLHEVFDASVDVSDRERDAPEERENHFLTRALAAFSIMTLAECDEIDAADAICDGYGDGGIDAVWFSEQSSHMILVQSKWKKSGGGVDLAGTLRFKQGVEHLLEGEKAHFTEQNVLSRWDKIQDVIATPSVRVDLVLATTANNVSSEITTEMTEYCHKVNDGVAETLRFRSFNLSEVHNTIIKTKEGAPIDGDLLLQDWGKLSDPHTAYYGKISATALAQFHEDHGDRLFDKNIRKVIRSSAVNETIVASLEVEPSKFWYLNNGVTALCSSIERAAQGGSSREAGIFRAQGLSIVNGAQTVGAIHSAWRRSPEALESAHVSMRIIVVPEDDQQFAQQVTRANNTQNQVKNKDFAALDPNQERLRRELLADDIIYEYKSGGEVGGNQGFGFEEAIVALACAFKGESSYCVLAKGSVGRLWEDIRKPPYARLVTKSVTGENVWALVRHLRVVETRLREARQARTGWARNVVVHGNRFIFRQVTHRLGISSANAAAVPVTEKQLRDETMCVVDEVEEQLKEAFDGSYLASLFKNQSKCQRIEAELRADNT